MAGALDAGRMNGQLAREERRMTDGDDIRVCIDRVFDDGHEELALSLAIHENPANDPGGQPRTRLALATAKKWKPGRTLRIRFLDGTDTMHEKVIRAAQPWTREANIDLAFGDEPKAEIRVSFRADRGSWSAIGTDALVEQRFPKYQATMNLGWLRDDTPDEEYARVVLHEFGHMLGCLHEHKSPASPIRWNEEAVYARYAGPPNNWSRAKIKANVIDRYASGETQFTAFDPTSIMTYAFPAALMLEGTGIARSSKLSATDIAFIRQHYPR
jgi:hypothetical protein